MTTGQSGHDHSLAIRQEIQRFESVHPSIYAIYDLIDLLTDTHIAKQIREHVVAIEGKRCHQLKLFKSHVITFDETLLILICTSPYLEFTFLYYFIYFFYYIT